MASLSDLGASPSAAVAAEQAPTTTGGHAGFPLVLSVTDGLSTAELEVTPTITQSVLFLSGRGVSGVSELFLSELGQTTWPHT